jgi:hypothetical protein
MVPSMRGEPVAGPQNQPPFAVKNVGKDELPLVTLCHRKGRLPGTLTYVDNAVMPRKSAFFYC